MLNVPQIFEGFAQMAREIEDYCASQGIRDVWAVYGMSMGGVLASHLWMNKTLSIYKVIMESSPLIKWEKIVTNMFTKQYITITQKAFTNRHLSIVPGFTANRSSIHLFCAFDLFPLLNSTTLIFYMKLDI